MSSIYQIKQAVLSETNNAESELHDAIVYQIEQLKSHSL